MNTMGIPKPFRVFAFLLLFSLSVEELDFYLLSSLNYFFFFGKDSQSVCQHH